MSILLVATVSSRWTLVEIMSQQQEARLSQRTLRVIEYLTKSLKVVRNGTLLKLW